MNSLPDFIGDKEAITQSDPEIGKMPDGLYQEYLDNMLSVYSVKLDSHELQTLLVMIDVCQRNYNCKDCGNKQWCDSVWIKLARAEEATHG